MRGAGYGRAVAAAFAGAAVVLIAALVIALSDRDVHLAGTNNVFDRFPVADLGPSDELCEQGEIVPADSAAVRLFVGEQAGAQRGPLRIKVVEEGRTVSQGSRAGGWDGGSVDVPIRTVRRTLSDAEVCVTNRGRSTLTLRGYGIDQTRLGFTLRGEESNNQVRLTYLRPDRESWWSIAGVVGHRFGLGRGELFGGWLVFAWLAGLVAMAAVVARLVLREAES
jgi:hypothetical protein